MKIKYMGKEELVEKTSEELAYELRLEMKSILNDLCEKGYAQHMDEARVLLKEAFMRMGVNEAIEDCVKTLLESKMIRFQYNDMKFTCKSETGTIWEGEIIEYEEYRSHYFIKISARGRGFLVFFGKASFGKWFVSITNWNVGLIIDDLRDTFSNAKEIGVALENVNDGISVAQGLYIFAKTLDIKEDIEFINEHRDVH